MGSTAERHDSEDEGRRRRDMPDEEHQPSVDDAPETPEPASAGAGDSFPLVGTGEGEDPHLLSDAASGGGGREPTALATVSSVATTGEAQAKAAAAGTPVSAPILPSSNTTMPTTAMSIMRAMDEKAMFMDQVNPLPQPSQNAVSLPGAFPQYGGRTVAGVRPAPVMRSVSASSSAAPSGSGDFNGDIAGANEDDNEQQQTAVMPAPSAESNGEAPPEREVSARHLPVAAELAEDHESLRLQEIEARIRKEFEAKMQEDYVRKSQVQALAELDLSDRDNIMFDGSTRAITVVAEAAPVSTDKTQEEVAAVRRKSLLLGLVLVILAAVIGIVLGVTLSREDDQQESERRNATTIARDVVDKVVNKTEPLLQSIKERGILLCKPESLELEKREGFTVELCKAISAAIFNDPNKWDYPGFSFRDHFGALDRGELDVSASLVSLNMGRDVREHVSQAGFTYSTPYLYTGTGIAGVPNFVYCAKKAETFEEDCRQLKVCVIVDTVTQYLVEAFLPGSATFLVEGDGELYTRLADGSCNVVAADGVFLYEQYARDAGYDGEYVIADQLLSHEHLSFLTRQQDSEWADFCDLIVRALITAEALNITQESAQTFGTTDLFGPDYENMFIQTIAAVGNYGEIYERTYGKLSPRTPYNQINTGNTGLIVSDPLGSLLVDDRLLSEEDLPGPIPNGTIEAVVSRAQLRCGVMLEDPDGTPRSGFAEFNRTTQEWSGMDVDYCRGLAASVSTGQTIDTVFVNLSDAATRFKSLANKTVDIIAGEKFSLVTDVREPTTGQGYTFATPYFYYNTTSLTDGGAIALVTRQDDSQWSDLAKWITQFTFYAEEEGITKETASEMPIVELFGMDYRQMIRDTVLAIGNYGEIYQRNLESIVPRGGRNLLNVEDTPQFYPIIPFLTTRR